MGMPGILLQAPGILGHVESAAVGTALRVAIAVLAGLIASIVLAYAATVLIVLATIGIPLGAESRPLTIVQATLLLVAVAASAFLGGRAARRLAPFGDRIVAIGLSAVLFTSVLWGFSGRNSWPAWWGPVTGVVMALGAWLGSRARPARPRGDDHGPEPSEA